MKRVLKVIKNIMNVFCWTALIILVVIVVLSLISRIGNTSPSIFGYSFYRVSSPSMEPELMVGDIILDENIENPKALKVGEIITFDGGSLTNGAPITHKVIKAPYEDIDGQWRLQTKGVANDTPDSEITLDKVQSKLVCKVPILTFIFNLFLSPWGLIIFFALIIFIFFDEVLNIIRILTKSDKDESKKESMDEIIKRIQSENSGGIAEAENMEADE